MGASKYPRSDEMYYFLRNSVRLHPHDAGQGSSWMMAGRVNSHRTMSIRRSLLVCQKLK